MLGRKLAGVTREKETREGGEFTQAVECPGPQVNKPESQSPFYYLPNDSLSLNLRLSFLIKETDSIKSSKNCKNSM